MLELTKHLLLLKEKGPLLLGHPKLLLSSCWSWRRHRKHPGLKKWRHRVRGQGCLHKPADRRRRARGVILELLSGRELGLRQTLGVVKCPEIAREEREHLLLLGLNK